MNNGSGSFGVAPFNFTIEKEEDAKSVQKYMQDQTEVIITYREEGIFFFCRSNVSAFLETIKPK